MPRSSKQSFSFKKKVWAADRLALRFEDWVGFWQLTAACHEMFYAITACLDYVVQSHEMLSDFVPV